MNVNADPGPVASRLEQLIFGHRGLILVAFAVLSIVSIVLWRRFGGKADEVRSQPFLNRRAEGFVESTPHATEGREAGPCPCPKFSIGVPP